MYSKYKRFFSLLIAVVIFLVSIPSVYAEDEKIIKVGYNDLPGFLYQDESGSYRGYAYELLQEIAGYNNWQFEYIQTPYSNIQQALESGEIDIFIPHQKTPEREKIYEYSNEIFCTNQASLLTRPDADLYYNDFANFDGIRVGVEKNTRNGERFMELFEANNCNVTLVSEYHNTAQMKEALANKEIDAFICTSNRGVEDCRIIFELDETNSYVLAKKVIGKYLIKLTAQLMKSDRLLLFYFQGLKKNTAYQKTAVILRLQEKKSNT